MLFMMMNTSTAAVPTVFIYGLAHPETDEIRYVGKTNNLDQRLHDHVVKAQTGRTHKDNWIRKVGQPRLVVLQYATEDNWKERERWWIATLPNLTNVRSGGDGPDRFRHSADTKQRMSEVHTLRCSNPTERERLRSISNGKPPVRWGEDNNKSKLTVDGVRRMRKLASEGVPGRELAHMFNVTYQNVWNVITRRTWARV